MSKTCMCCYEEISSMLTNANIPPSNLASCMANRTDKLTVATVMDVSKEYSSLRLALILLICPPSLVAEGRWPILTYCTFKAFFEYLKYVTCL